MRLVRNGLFPAPIKLTPAKNGRVRFAEEDIEKWLDERRRINAVGSSSDVQKEEAI
jgi:predicted DNA-binding transcriptional regulator AlpA